MPSTRPRRPWLDPSGATRPAVGLLRSRPAHHLLAAAVLVVGVLASLAVGERYATAERERAAAGFDRVAGSYAAEFEARFTRKLVAISGVADLVAIVGPDDDGAFATAAARVRRREPSLPALGKVVAVGDVRAWERATGNDGLVRPTRSGPAVLIQQVEPANGAMAAARGFDLASEANRLAAIDAARQGGVPVATAPVALVPVVPGNGLGTTVIVPSYDGGRTPVVLAERRARFIGGVAAPLAPVEAIDELATDALRVEVWDAGAVGASEVERIHMVSSDRRVVADADAPGMRRVLPVEVANRRWELVVDDLTGLGADVAAGPTQPVTLAGLAIVVLLASLVLVGGASLRRVGADRDLLERHVAERTAELQALAVELERTNAELERFVYQSAHDLRTPLTMVLGTLAWLEQHADVEGLDRDLLDRAGRAAERMRRRLDVLVDQAHEVAAGRPADPDGTSLDGTGPLEHREEVAEPLPSSSTPGA